MTQSPPRIAIIGGGPGGLMTAYRLQQMEPLASITIFEASSRFGGKILTRRLSSCGARYEAGAAELYDYSHLGADPLKELILELGLSIATMEGPGVFFDGRWLETESELAAHFGPAGYAQLQAFADAARQSCTPAEYYESDWRDDANDSNARLTFSRLLNSVTNPQVRRYIETVVHSDVAVESERTSALYGLQNWLMNDPDYMQLYYIQGGIELLILRVLDRLQCERHLNTRIQRVVGSEGGGYDLIGKNSNGSFKHHFDALVTALPVNQLSQIQWEPEPLAAALRAHRSHYDHPAHYLRITLVFESPFWREKIPGLFFMLDAFGGCCVYDESARNPNCSHGVLGWLLAGDAALVHANLADDDLIALALSSLPDDLKSKAGSVVEGAVHRWAGAVNGWPMGSRAYPPEQRHAPASKSHPNFFLVGDYLFDSTLNGVLDSAEWVAEALSDRMNEPDPARSNGSRP
jgi:monoamine oxidase